MRVLFFLFVISVSAASASAARRVTVEQLHLILEKQKQTNRSDGETAREIANLELTERLSPKRLAQLCSELKPGPKAVLALTLLGDTSAFLDSPLDQLRSMSPPDSDAQKTILSAVYQHTALNVQQLPDFFATRTTRSFDDSQAARTDFGGTPIQGRVHFVGTIDQEITYRNGREELGGAALQAGTKPHSAPASQGLSSWGEFGALPAIILADSARGRLDWSHWERDVSGAVAVFVYKVPRVESHYLVKYCCVRNSEGLDLDHPYIQRSDVANAYEARPAYHGTLSVDPTSGAILRLTLQAELKTSDPISQMDVAVEFGTVSLGGRSYTCPLQSVAISSTLVGSDTSSAEWKVLRIKDVRFTNYHKFGSTVTILPGNSEP